MRWSSGRIGRLLALGVLVNGSAVSADPKVTPCVLGPATSDVVYVLSPAGVHVAAGKTKGSRYTVALDGVDGPTYDAIMTVTSAAGVASPPDPESRLAGYTPRPVVQTPVVFSANGKRYAYLARAGQDYVVVVDGQEQRRFPAASGTQVRMQFTGPTGSKHLMSVSGVNGLFAVFVDGQPWPAHDANEVPVVSRDGAHIAYVATPDAQDRKKTVLVVDGKPADYAADTPRFTADGRHVLATTRGINAQTLLLDGKPVASGPSLENVYVAPAGDKFVAVVSKPNPGGAHYVCVVDGQEAAATEGTNPPVVVFSPDGRHWAARCRNTAGAAVSWLATDDGKKGPEYVAIDEQSIRFSPDGTRLAYVAGNNSKWFAVIDGHESDGFGVGLKVGFSPDGKRAYYAGLQDQPTVSRLLVIDDQSYRGDHNFNTDSLVFSADGSRWAALASGLKSGGPSGLQSVDNLLVDGKLVPGFTVATVLLSPDGKHFAFLGQRQSDRANGLFLDDGKTLKLNTGTRGRPVRFSPDGKHLFWSTLETDPATNKVQHAIYADGLAVARYDNVALGNFEADPNAWQVAADGTLTTVGVVGDQVMCYRVTPGDDASVVGAAEAFSAAEAKAAAEKQAALDAAAKQKADAAAAAKQKQADAAAARQKAIDDRKAAAAAKKAAADAARDAARRAKQGN